MKRLSFITQLKKQLEEKKFTFFPKFLPGSGPIQWVRGGCGAKAPLLAARP